MKKRVFINIHYLEIGGAERALLGLLSALDPEKVDVDLFVNQHTGEFMQLVPDYVNLLPEVPEYTCIERPIKDIVMEGHFGIAFRRLMAKYKNKKYQKTLTEEEIKHDASIFQYVYDEVESVLPSLYHLGEYDLAISFLMPHNIVLNKVRAKKRVCWIHTDYSSNVSFNSLKIGSYYMDIVYPLEAKQWVSNALQDVTVKTYQNSAWVDWIALTKKLIWEGATEYTLNTSGGVTRQNGDGYISFQGSGEGYRNMWINDVDLSYHTRLIVEGSFDNLGASSDALRVWSNSTSSPSKDNSTAKKDLSSTGATLDISSLNGLYKVGISWEYTPLQKITNFYLDN